MQPSRVLTTPEEQDANSQRDHRRAKAFRRHQIEVSEIKRHAQHWRLVDCSLETLEQMRHALLEEMARLEETLAEADRRFLRYMENGRPLKTQQARQRIDRLSAEWESLNDHLQEIDNAILERRLRSRLETVLGGPRGVNLLEALVLVAILVIVTLTIVELTVALPAATVVTILRLDTVISFFLLGDFFLRMSLAEDKVWYVRRYWIDFISSIPFAPVLHFGRLVRITRFVRLLRLFRLGRALRVLLFAFRGLDKLGRTLQLNLLKRSMLVALALLIFGALSIGAIEGPREASLQSLPESVWWSFTTVVTGGFADLYNPTTTSGRAITVGLVLLGLVVTGIFTASLTSVLVEDESTRLEHSQRALENDIGVLNQKLDLLSGETNAGLIALEEVAQALANQTSPHGVANVLAQAMLDDFQGLQASVHLLDETQTALQRINHAGDGRFCPPPSLPLSADHLATRAVGELLHAPDLAIVDVEPSTEPSFHIAGLCMACPLVAGRQVLGVLHLVLPDDRGRFYLYNRAPQTLAHQAATAFYALRLAEQAPGAAA